MQEPCQTILCNDFSYLQKYAGNLVNCNFSKVPELLGKLESNLVQ